MPDPDGKQDIGSADLDDPQGKHGGKDRRGEIRLLQAQRREDDPGRQLAEEAGGDGIRAFSCVHHENTRVADPGNNGDHISRQVAHPDPVHKEQYDAQQHRKAGEDIGAGWFLPVNHRHQEDHEDRRRELEHDGVSSGGHLVCEGKEGGDPDHGKGAGQHPPAENDLPAGQQEIKPDHGCADQVPGTVDGQGGPRDQLDEQAAGAETYGGQENKQRRPHPGFPCHPNPPLNPFIRETARLIRSRISQTGPAVHDPACEKPKRLSFPFFSCIIGSDGQSHMKRLTDRRIP